MHFDRHEPGIRLPSYAKDPKEERYFLELNRALANATLPSERPETDPETLPLIYIVGAPRSGTTLLSQLVSRHLRVGYINNLIARFWMRPSAGIWLSRALLGEDARNEIALRSSFGTTAEIAGPHEFGYFWRHWLRLDESPTHHLDRNALELLDAEGLRQALQHEILAAFGQPVAFKNVICGFHAAFLTGLHKPSIFVHIRRDLFSTAASILKSRRERFGSYETWWSLKPSTWPFRIDPPNPALEVVTQVAECRREVHEELSRPGIWSLSMTYEALCEQPRECLERIRASCLELGQVVDWADSDISSLEPSKEVRLPARLNKQLRSAIERYES